MNLARLLERLLHLIPVLLGVSAIVFLMTLATPGDPVDIMLGEQQATPAQRAALRKDMGLDLPAPQRFRAFPGERGHGQFRRVVFSAASGGAT